jgi:hypothetical protein
MPSLTSDLLGCAIAVAMGAVAGLGGGPCTTTRPRSHCWCCVAGTLITVVDGERDQRRGFPGQKRTPRRVTPVGQLGGPSLAAPGRPRLGGVREQLGEYVPDEGVTLHVERQDQLGVTHGVGLPPGQPIQRAIATRAGQIDNESAGYSSATSSNRPTHSAAQPGPLRPNNRKLGALTDNSPFVSQRRQRCPMIQSQAWRSRD